MWNLVALYLLIFFLDFKSLKNDMVLRLSTWSMTVSIKIVDLLYKSYALVTLNDNRTGVGRETVQAMEKYTKTSYPCLVTKTVLEPIGLWYHSLYHVCTVPGHTAVLTFLHNILQPIISFFRSQLSLLWIDHMAESHEDLPFCLNILSATKMTVGDTRGRERHSSFSQFVKMVLMYSKDLTAKKVWPDARDYY